MSDPTPPGPPAWNPPNYPQQPPAAPPPPTSNIPGAALGFPPPTGAFAAPPGAFPPPATLAPAGKGGSGRRIAIAIAAVAVLAGATFGAIQFFGAEAGGADRPEQVGDLLIAAVVQEDILGLLDVTLPGERDLLRDILESDTAELERLGIVGEAFQLDGVDGVDITATDVEFDADLVSGDVGGPDDGLALVASTAGEMAIEVDGGVLEGALGDTLVDLLEANGVDVDIDNFSETTDDVGADPIQFAAVEEGGRWFFSAFFTIAETQRLSAAENDSRFEDAPDLERPEIEAAGAASPEDAVSAFVDAAVDFDVRGLLELLDPGEAFALQVYAQYFIDEVAGEADSAADDFDISVDVRSFDVDDLGGGVSRVIPLGLEAEFSTSDGTTGTVTLDECVTVDITGPDGDTDEEVCRDEVDSFTEEQFGDDVEIPSELDDLVAVFDDIRAGIVVVQRDGEHFVSPLRTVNDVLFSLVRAVETDDIEQGGILFDAITGEISFGALFDEVFGSATEEFEDVGVVLPGGEFEECEGVGCGFDEEPTPTRPPTGATGPSGEIVLGNVVAGSVAEDEEQGFSIVGAGVDVLIGVQGISGFDGFLRVFDAEGNLIAEEDDTVGHDPEVLLLVDDFPEGAVFFVEVSGFGGDAGDFVVYYEPF